MPARVTSLQSGVPLPKDDHPSQWTRDDLLRLLSNPGDKRIPTLRLKRPSGSGYVEVRPELQYGEPVITKMYYGSIRKYADREYKYLYEIEQQVENGDDGLEALSLLRGRNIIGQKTLYNADEAGHEIPPERVLYSRWFGLDMRQWMEVLKPVRHCFTQNEYAFLGLVRGILKRIERFHELGYVHCDLLPRNIIIPCKLLLEEGGSRFFLLDLDNPYFIDLELCLKGDSSDTSREGWYLDDNKAPYEPNPDDRSKYICPWEVKKDESGKPIYDRNKPVGGELFTCLKKVDWGVDLFSLGIALRDIIRGYDFKDSPLHQNANVRYLKNLPQELQSYEFPETRTKHSRPHKPLINQINGLIHGAGRTLKVPVSALYGTRNSKSFVGLPTVSFVPSAEEDYSLHPTSTGQTSPAQKSRSDAKAPRRPAAETLVNPPDNEEDRLAAPANPDPVHVYAPVPKETKVNGPWRPGGMPAPSQDTGKIPTPSPQEKLDHAAVARDSVKAMPTAPANDRAGETLVDPLAGELMPDEFLAPPDHEDKNNRLTELTKQADKAVAGLEERVKHARRVNTPNEKKNLETLAIQWIIKQCGTEFQVDHKELQKLVTQWITTEWNDAKGALNFASLADLVRQWITGEPGDANDPLDVDRLVRLDRLVKKWEIRTRSGTAPLPVVPINPAPADQKGPDDSKDTVDLVARGKQFQAELAAKRAEAAKRQRDLQARLAKEQDDLRRMQAEREQSPLDRLKTALSALVDVQKTFRSDKPPDAKFDGSFKIEISANDAIKAAGLTDLGFSEAHTKPYTDSIGWHQSGTPATVNGAVARRQIESAIGKIRAMVAEGRLPESVQPATTVAPVKPFPYPPEPAPQKPSPPTPTPAPAPTQKATEAAQDTVKAKPENETKTLGFFFSLFSTLVVLSIVAGGFFMLYDVFKQSQNEHATPPALSSQPAPAPSPPQPQPTPKVIALIEAIQAAVRAINAEKMGSDAWKTAVDNLASACKTTRGGSKEKLECLGGWRGLQQRYLDSSATNKNTPWWTSLKIREPEPPPEGMLAWLNATRTLAEHGLWTAKVNQAMAVMRKVQPGTVTLASRKDAAQNLANLISKSAPRAQDTGFEVDTPPDAERKLRIEGAQWLWMLAKSGQEEGDSEARAITPRELVRPTLEAVAKIPSQGMQAAYGYALACWYDQPDEAKTWFRAAGKEIKPTSSLDLARMCGKKQ